MEEAASHSLSTKFKPSNTSIHARRLPFEAAEESIATPDKDEVDILAIESSEDSQLEEEVEMPGCPQQHKIDAVSYRHRAVHSPNDDDTRDQISVIQSPLPPPPPSPSLPAVKPHAAKFSSQDSSRRPTALRHEVDSYSSSEDSDNDPSWYPEMAIASSQKFGNRKRSFILGDSIPEVNVNVESSNDSDLDSDLEGEESDLENEESDLEDEESGLKGEERGLQSKAARCDDNVGDGETSADQQNEIQSSNSNDSLFCDDCNALHDGDCPVHGPLKPLDSTGQDQASLAHTPLPVPSPLTVKPSSISGAGLGVFATQLIPKRVLVGPYEGKRVDKEDLGRLEDNEYVWELREGVVIEGAVDASDPAHSNWLRFVNCARHEEEQNMAAFQYRGEIYYRTIKDIHPGTELLVWYGDQYASELGLCLMKEAGPAASHQCLGCGCAFVEEKALQLHVKYSTRCSQASLQTHSCMKCRRQFHQLEALQQHIRRHILLDSICKKLAGKHECKVCGKRFLTYASYRGHILLHRAPSCKCMYCGKAFVYKHDLEVHVRIHTGDKPWKCKDCGKCFSQSGNLERHVRIHTGARPYKCEFCENTFRHKASFHRHLRRHAGEKPHKCEQCGKRFSEVSSLKRHFTTHSAVGEAHKCDLCGKCFRSASSLKQHSKVHFTDSKQHKCEFCDRYFKTKYHLARHLPTHSDLATNLYKCDTCEKSFVWKCHLEIHLRQHAGDRPFKCEECGSFLSSRGALTTHLLTHTNEKPFSCEVCGRKFGRKWHMLRHLWTHSDKKRYNCEHCEKGFSDMRYYKRHLHTTHGKKTDLLKSTQATSSAVEVC